MTLVLPEPAPASMSRGPSRWVTASRCSLLRPSKRSSADLASSASAPEPYMLSNSAKKSLLPLLFSSLKALISQANYLCQMIISVMWNYFCPDENYYLDITG